ncbi:hypothetical protein CDAR_182431 [Caerostris darwini]|uniref:Uncharacterized protein n=1 Tax=Caerostris darwini TaxID=1538125 RepID=A0AAV4U5L2_9ARAC|nr:hypothetical protein CDAR_182431 [Caerostris darwini]
MSILSNTNCNEGDLIVTELPYLLTIYNDIRNWIHGIIGSEIGTHIFHFLSFFRGSLANSDVHFTILTEAPVQTIQKHSAQLFSRAVTPHPFVFTVTPPQFFFSFPKRFLPVVCLHLLYGRGLGIPTALEIPWENHFPFTPRNAESLQNPIPPRPFTSLLRVSKRLSAKSSRVVKGRWRDWRK